MLGLIYFLWHWSTLSNSTLRATLRHFWHLGCCVAPIQFHVCKGKWKTHIAGGGGGGCERNNCSSLQTVAWMWSRGETSSLERSEESGLGTREFTISPSSFVNSKHLLSCWQASCLLSVSSSSLLPVSKHGFDSYTDPSNQRMHTLHPAPWPQHPPT